jgi:hypothetical protein
MRLRVKSALILSLFRKKGLSHVEAMRLQTFLRGCRGDSSFAIALLMFVFCPGLTRNSKVTALVLAPQTLNDATRLACSML